MGAWESVMDLGLLLQQTSEGSYYMSVSNNLYYGPCVQERLSDAVLFEPVQCISENVEKRHGCMPRRHTVGSDE